VAYIRVKDRDTGHEFDALEGAWQIEAGIYSPVKSDRYPAAQYPRPAKHRVRRSAAVTDNQVKEPENG
jgi:hypothetical protein